MAPQTQEKVKRRKKKAPRTEGKCPLQPITKCTVLTIPQVDISESEASDHERSPSPVNSTLPTKASSLATTEPITHPPTSDPETPTVTTENNTSKTDAEVTQVFTAYYMDHIVREFADDLDKIRASEDFSAGGESLEILIGALRSGVDGFGMEERRRVVGGGWAVVNQVMIDVYGVMGCWCGRVWIEVRAEE